MVKNENELTHRIIRGVNVKVVNGKRAPLAFVILSKNRAAELEALKGNAFYQKLTLVTDRDDKTVFRTKLNNFSEAEAFVEQATAAALEAGIGGTVEAKTVTKTQSKTATA